jgi:hypothetical protein
LEKSLYNADMVKIDPKDLLTVAQAAELRRVSRQAINHLIRQDKINVVEIAGVRFIKRSEIENFIPDLGGRPSDKKGVKK